MEQIHKYPRTHHLQGSRCQPGDEDMEAIPWAAVRGRQLVVEEKMDGANAAVSFCGGRLYLQSRGHYLTGGAREKHFDLFKQWAATHTEALGAALDERYVMYGEWLYAKHTVYYDRLPHYFMEFDVLDRRAGEFLDTPRRRALLAGLPVAPVRVLWQGVMRSPARVTALLGRSRFIGARHIEGLAEACRQRGLDPVRAVGETDPSAEMEGLYIKDEQDGVVRRRYKYVRASFLTAVRDSESHWLSRPIVPNGLAEGVDLFRPARGDG